MTGSRLAEVIRTTALGLGFDRVGFVADGVSQHMTHVQWWLDQEYHGEMSYLGRSDAVARRGDLARSLDGFKSAVVVAHEYGHGDPARAPADPRTGLIARYARGRDYHDVLKERLERLAALVSGLVDEDVATRAYTDTGPLLERELASRGGLGWFGKNTMLIDPRHGSYFFLGVLLTSLELEPSGTVVRDHCGSCTRCIDACPTGALLGRDASGAPVMDARRCISYLTIELKGPIARELRPAMGNRVFGCDICQEVCPFNGKFSEPSREPRYRPDTRLDEPDLVELARALLAMSEKGFQRAFRGSPIVRARRKGLLRNVCIALGNWGAEDTATVLIEALADRAPLVRGHAAWALGRTGLAVAADSLKKRLQEEEDVWVRGEIEFAIDECNGVG